MSDIKAIARSKADRDRYLDILRSMSPEKRLLKAFELSDFVKRLFMQGFHKLHPNLTEREFHSLMLKQLEKSHNRNY